jgi:hypothetical protein
MEIQVSCAIYKLAHGANFLIYDDYLQLGNP